MHVQLACNSDAMVMAASAHTTLTTCGHRRFCLLEVKPRKFDSYDAKVAYFEQLAQDVENQYLDKTINVTIRPNTTMSSRFDQPTFSSSRKTVSTQRAS